MASIVHRVNCNTDPGLAHCWTLEKILDESQLTGELNLSGRNLKEFPEYAKQCDMGDTVVAGKCFSLIPYINVRLIHRRVSTSSKQ